MNEVDLKLREMIVNSFNLNIDPKDLKGNQEYFLEQYGVNSIDTLELLLEVEQEFDIEIDDEDLSADLLKTFNNFSSYVQKAMSA